MFKRTLPKIKIKLFLPGKKVPFNGGTYTVENVCVRQYLLMVKFKELEYNIDADKINCEYEEIDVNRISN